MKFLIIIILLTKVSLASVTLSLEALTTQNEYVTTYSGSVYLQGTLEIGITTDEDIVGFSMGISHYNGMGVGQPYGGLVEEYDFTMSSIFGATITGGHNMFPQDHYIPAGTTDETLMYVPILISENNDEEFCIQPGVFSNLEGNSVEVLLDENSCISIEDMTVSGIPVVIINDGAEDAEAEMGSTFTLNATSSFDPDGTIESYFWSQSSEGAQVEFSSENESIVTFTVPTEENDDVVCIVSLTVTDNDGNTAMSELTVTGIENTESDGSVTLTIESLTTQNEYVTTYSGSVYLQGTLEIGITTDEDIVGFSMGISHYNGMGVGQPYGGLVEEYDFTMSSIFGATITGGHNMFPQDHYIPAGTTDETLMYVPILISENNDEEFCIQPGVFSNLEGNSVTVNLNEESCISMDEITGLDSTVATSDTLIIRVVDLETGEGIEGAQGTVMSWSNDFWTDDYFSEFETDDSGYVYIVDFPIGMSYVDVYNEEHYPASQQFTYSGSEQITIGMQPLGFNSDGTDTLEIQFIDQNTGEPIPYVNVDISVFNVNWDNDCWDDDCFGSIITDENGYAVIQDFPLGLGWLEASKSGYLTLGSQYLFDGSEQLTFNMEPFEGYTGEADTIVIQIVDSNTGNGISGAYGDLSTFGVNENSWGEEITFSILTNDEGFATIEDYPVDYYAYGSVYADGYSPIYLQFDPADNDTIIYAMENLGNLATVSGTVLFEQDTNSFLTPFIFAMSTENSIEQYGSSVAVDGNGSYELALIPGDYVIGALYFNSQVLDWTDENIDMEIQLQFYENSLTFEGATTVMVMEGTTTENVNFDFINNTSLEFNGQLGNMVMGQVTSNNEINMHSTVVSVLDLNGQVVSEQTINYDQNFSLTGLNQNQDYILLASHSEFGTVEKEFFLSSMVHVETIEFDLSQMSTDNNQSQFPARFSLSQNFPNPFNPTTEIKYELPAESLVNITIYDLMGRKINALVNQEQSAGSYSLQWDATNNVGEAVPAGMYIYTIQAGKFNSTKKMVLLK